MAGRLLQLLALWTIVVGIVQCCPELCSCQDKFAHQFADCSYKDLLVVPLGLPSNVTTDLLNLTALQLLKMNNNEMLNLPMDAFSTLKDLRSLRINNNKFTTIVQGTFNALTSMSHLQIFNNPFTCSCSLEWLRDWILTTKISVPEPNLVSCEAPEHLKGTMVTLIPKLDCKAPTIKISYEPNIENTELYEVSTVILKYEALGSPTPQVSREVTGNCSCSAVELQITWITLTLAVTVSGIFR
ncbi:Immunoglobulin superfamily containing leucine-rich repeat protein 2 [Dissostichus eleginoides]|nr:Immunoglobulin superfamily containing leucine-rich repeat protein 2 [Dissostichus eleginoides]